MSRDLVERLEKKDKKRIYKTDFSVDKYPLETLLKRMGRIQAWEKALVSGKKRWRELHGMMRYYRAEKGDKYLYLYFNILTNGKKYPYGLEIDWMHGLEYAEMPRVPALYLSYQRNHVQMTEYAFLPYQLQPE